MNRHESWKDGMTFDDIPEVGPTERHPDALWLLEKELASENGWAVLLADRMSVHKHVAHRLIMAGIKIGELRERRRAKGDARPRARRRRGRVPRGVMTERILDVMSMEPMRYIDIKKACGVSATGQLLRDLEKKGVVERVGRGVYRLSAGVRRTP